MKFGYALSIAVLNFVPLASAHGGGEKASQTGFSSVSLEVLLLITLAIGILISIIVYKYAKIADKRLFSTMIIVGSLFLVLDYALIKFVILGGD